MVIRFLRAKWKNLVMVNYAVDPALLEPYLPPGTSLDYFEGKTYVSLVGFLFAKTKIFGIPVPRFGTFEEINLRFYVYSKEDKIKKRGVVFINEAVPYKSVAWMANLLYKEHYSVMPTRHYWEKNSRKRLIEYYWKKKERWNAIQVETDTVSKSMKQGSLEEFIFEHYYGFTKISDSSSESYEVVHPRWSTFDVKHFKVDCDFEAMYGSSFAHLSAQLPDSVMLARGSDIAVNLKREKIIIST
jgi:uncharacterized protein YqjF (DUF2071 family)